MKNEGPNILEWIAYHRAIGFSNFIIGSNDCEDKSDLLLDALALEGVIAHRRTAPRAGEDPQYILLRCLQDNPIYRESDWIMELDADEFLNVRIGQGRVDDLLSSLPDADAIVVLWKTFGDSGQLEWKGGLTLDEFTQCEADLDKWNRFHKTLFRNNGKFLCVDAHYPELAPTTCIEELNVYNTAGAKYDVSYLARKAPSISFLQTDEDRWTWDNACVNHYPVKSPDLLAMKRHRGDNVPGRGEEKYRPDSAYGWLAVKNDVSDTSIQRLLPKTIEQMELLRASHVIRDAEAEMLEAFKALRERVLAEAKGSETPG